MAKHKKKTSTIYESFSDLALMTLEQNNKKNNNNTNTTQNTKKNEQPKHREQIAQLEQQLKLSEADKERLKKNIEKVIVTDPENEASTILSAANVGRKDFDLFIEGLKDIQGKDLHLVIDATGSMHGGSGFLIPMLRLIVARSGKQVSAITWFSDNNYQTYTGGMGDMFDHLMQGAPFVGNIENIGHAFRSAAQAAPAPGAYMLIGDESSDDTISYTQIPSPVFTRPLGRNDSAAEREYKTLAEKTRGKMLHLDFK